jgi:hypothetical protein
VAEQRGHSPAETATSSRFDQVCATRNTAVGDRFARRAECAQDADPGSLFFRWHDTGFVSGQ